MTGFSDAEDTFSTEDPPRDLPERDNLSLLVLSGPDSGRLVRVKAEGGVIGRGENADIRLTDPYVSRAHAKLERGANGKMVLRDLGSRYGSYVEGERVETSELGDGQRIQISAETVIRVRFEDTRESQLLDQLQHAAMTDVLTGLSNRRYLLERLDQELSFSTRHKTPLALLMIDLDDFKEINDTHGHGAGDRVLQVLAQILTQTIRREDVAARYAGDEFIVISRGAPEDQVVSLAERIRERAAARSVLIGNDPVSIKLSIGVAGFDPAKDAHIGAMELIARVDAALYKSKRGGRDRVSLWREETLAFSSADTIEQVTMRLDFPKE